MAQRLVFSAAILLSVAATSAEKAFAYEDNIPDEIHIVADEYGLDANDLYGAMISTGIWNPRDYLCAVGEEPCGGQVTLAKTVSPSPVPSTGMPSSGIRGVWLSIKGCETPGLGWNANTGNGFEGGLQFLNSTWLEYGGGRYASHAYLASPSQQVDIAENVLAANNGHFYPWPRCRQILGLR